MKHIVWEENRDEYPVCILIKESSLNKSKLERYYVEPLEKLGIDKNQVIAFSLDYNGKNAPATLCREYLDTLAPILNNLGVKYIYMCDGNYAKRLGKLGKLDPHYGYALDCVQPGYEEIKMVLGIPYTGLFHNPNLAERMNRTIKVVADLMLDKYVIPGEGKLKTALYPETEEDIIYLLKSLMDKPVITCDIEAFSLKHYNAGIGTIAFSWSDCEGFCFAVDYVSYGITEPDENGDRFYAMDDEGNYGYRIDNKRLKKILKSFFKKYKGKVVYHGITYDAKVLVYELFMEHDLDYRNQLNGIEIMTENATCTKVITYLATNNCAQNSLGLKDIAQEWGGDWAEDVEDILKVPLPKLKTYNVGDSCATFWALEKYWPILVEEEQSEVYYDLFLPFIPVVLETELNGMPMSPEIIQKNSEALDRKINILKLIIDKAAIVCEFDKVLRQIESDKKHAEWKEKTAPIEHFDYIKFNPGSSKQLQRLLHDEWGFPITSTTKTGAPETGREILEGHMMRLVREHNIDERYYQPETSHPGNQLPYPVQQARLLWAISQWTRAVKIQNTFFRAMKNGRLKADGCIYLHGNFNQTGTKSGRLSSSDPNMQNLPSKGTPYAKIIKECFVAPPNMLFGGADFDSLEDKISALTTKDPNKLKVYIDGYDGHCLRAFSYFGNQMENINPDSVESINSIEELYPDLRQDSKTPTFALTYQGTWHTLVAKSGFSKQEAKSIETKYHELYKVSDEWVAEKIREAGKTGYVTLAFGLRLRTPLLARTDLNKSYTPYEAAKESRTAGNALGQGYCMLNNRAAIEFRDRLKNSPYRMDVRIIGMIHDAIYLIWKKDLEVTKWVSDNLTECMAWQELPDIQHDTVKLSGSLDIFHPNWNVAIGLPRGASTDEIKTIVRNEMKKNKR